MGDEPCNCTETPRRDSAERGEESTDRTRTADRWIDDDRALAASLPADLQRALGSFLGVGRVETLDEWVEIVRRRTGGGALSVGELCHADAETGHRGETSERTYHFRCFYDAVVLAALAEEPVDIRTESPEGAVIRAEADGDGDLEVTPAGAVFSFGIDEDAAAESDGDPALGDVYRANCPYVKAFPDRAAYEAWTGTVPAATAALPLAGATELAVALAD